MKYISHKDDRRHSESCAACILYKHVGSLQDDFWLCLVFSCWCACLALGWVGDFGLIQGLAILWYRKELGIHLHT